MWKFVLAFLVSVPLVMAGSLTGDSSSAGSSGTTYTAEWSQGCAAQGKFLGGRHVWIGPEGPNACEELPPYYCPTDSTGSNLDWEERCDLCGCPYLSECQPDGTCNACQDPCDLPDTCADGYICESTPPAEDNSCDYDVACIPVENRVFVEYVDYNTWCPDHRKTELSDPLMVWQTQSYYDSWGGNCAGEYEVHLSWSEGSTGPVANCDVGPDWWVVEECRIADWKLQGVCSWWLGGSASEVVAGSGEVSGAGWECNTLFGTSHGASYDITQTTGGWECRQYGDYGSGGDVDLYLNGVPCD